MAFSLILSLRIVFAVAEDMYHAEQRNKLQIIVAFISCISCLYDLIFQTLRHCNKHPYSLYKQSFLHLWLA